MSTPAAIPGVMHFSAEFQLSLLPRFDWILSVELGFFLYGDCVVVSIKGFSSPPFFVKDSLRLFSCIIPLT